MDTFFQPCHFSSILAEFDISKTCQIVGLPDDSFMYFIVQKLWTDKYGHLSIQLQNLYVYVLYSCFDSVANSDFCASIPFIKKILQNCLLQSQASGDSLNWGKENAP